MESFLFSSFSITLRLPTNKSTFKQNSHRFTSYQTVPYLYAYTSSLTLTLHHTTVLHQLPTTKSTPPTNNRKHDLPIRLPPNDLPPHRGPSLPQNANLLLRPHNPRLHPRLFRLSPGSRSFRYHWTNRLLRDIFFLRWLSERRR